MTAAIKVLDLGQSQPKKRVEDVGILNIPCNIDMTGKQSNCYNVQALTKEKASSKSSYSNHYM